MEANHAPRADANGSDDQGDQARQTKKPTKRDVYQEVTDRIVGLLEKGTPPWRQPIKRAGGDATPKSLASGKAYRGINVFLLAMTAWAHGYDSSYWTTCS